MSFAAFYKSTVIGVCLLGSTAFAGGSLSTSDILAETDSQLLKTIQTNFYLSYASTGTRIGGQIAPALGGARVGPYITCARPVGSVGTYTLSLVFNTDTKYVDKNGEFVPLGKNSVRIVEKVTNVQIESAADFCQAVR